ncbi:MAG: deoxyribose-phosphate aldolase [Flavobacteriaceae bacterium]|nr:deoxyribose-phosphate aldolase [Flavobacteriaceae bacterium]
MEIHQYIDHTLLKPTATKADIEQLCKEALQYSFASVCVNSAYVAYAKNILSDQQIVKVCTVVGFPLGAMSTKAKIAEAKIAINDGADEIDMVMAIGSLKDKDYKSIETEIAAIKAVCGNKLLKVILEICYLDAEEISKACELAVAAGADFVKTSTGFGTGGASKEAIQNMYNSVGGNAAIKASGGIRDFDAAKSFINMGVSRIGTSNGVAIVTGATATNNY